MKKLVFSTGNAQKFQTALAACKKVGIELTQKDMDIPEIQSEDPEAVALDKGQKAYEKAGGPVVVTDDSWAYLGLKGFPGVYMHSINHWFSVEDFLNLTRPLKNRKVIFTQYLVYTDESGQKVFTRQQEGELLHESRGNPKHPNLTITSLLADKGKSIAEVFESVADKSDRPQAQIWHEFTKWFLEQ